MAGLEPSQQGPALTFDQAVEAAIDGRDAEALEAFRRLVAASPNDHQARLWIARLHVQMGHQELAEPVYRSVLLEDPGNVAAMLGVASALLARNEPAEAIEVLEPAEALAPQNDSALAALGRAHREAGRTARAIAYFERAVALAPIQQHRLSLERARLSYLHRVETRGFSEQFNGSTPDSRSGDLILNVRLTDTLRVLGRGQVQRKFAVSEQRGGGGVEWRWKPTTILRAQALVGPDNRVMPEGDYLGELDYTRGPATWTASVRHFDFTGARTSVFSPAVSWLPAERLSLDLRYAVSWTETNTLPPAQTGHSALVRGAYRVYPRVWVNAGYAGGVEEFESFSIDRIGDFRANTISAGLRIDLPALTGVVGNYEHQWRKGGIDMGRVTVSLLQRF